MCWPCPSPVESSSFPLARDPTLPVDELYAPPTGNDHHILISSDNDRWYFFGDWPIYSIVNLIWIFSSFYVTYKSLFYTAHSLLHYEWPTGFWELDWTIWTSDKEHSGFPTVLWGSIPNSMKFDPRHLFLISNAGFLLKLRSILKIWGLETHCFHHKWRDLNP